MDVKLILYLYIVPGGANGINLIFIECQIKSLLKNSLVATLNWR